MGTKSCTKFLILARFSQQDFVPFLMGKNVAQKVFQDFQMSQSQEVGSGDEGLGLFSFDLASAETEFWWLEDEQ